MPDRELIQGLGLTLTPDPLLPRLTGEIDRAVIAYLADLAAPSGAARIGTVGGTMLDAKLAAMDVAIAAGGGGGGGGGVGPAGASAYLHTRYSNDGGLTFTASGGTVAGSYLGTYSSSSPTASASVAKRTLFMCPLPSQAAAVAAVVHPSLI